ncbi:unnamed protein product [Malus baccata var. baccata]
MTYGAAAETQGETSSYVRGDHKGEYHSLQTKESSRNNSSSTSSSGRNSFKQFYTGTGMPMLPSGSRPNKRALLCGLTCKHLKYNLKGIHNDVMNMEDLLIKTLGFPANCIRILSEDDPLDLERIPTKKNIENSLKWLVEDCQRGDSLVFYFLGHGLRQSDFKDDELDGFDETICPVDFMKERIVLDNDINETIVRPLKEENIPPSGVRKSTNGGLAISLSTCEDNTTAFTGRAMQGAMTYILTHHNYGRFSHKNTEKLKNNPDITYGVLLDSMLNHFKKINRERWSNSRFLRTLLQHKTIQLCFHFLQHLKLNGEPMLSSSEKFDVNLKKFL